MKFSAEATDLPKDASTQDVFLEQEKNILLKKPALFTLIAYAEDFQAYSYCIASIRAIIKRLPCKVLFASVEQIGSNAFYKESLALRERDGAKYETDCECLFIRTSEDQLHRIPFAFLPEIVPDLPVYLLFQGSPGKKIAIFQMLMPYITKIIFSSAQEGNYQLFTQEADSSPYIHKYLDLQWVQMRPWQETILRIFDDEKRQEALHKISALRICYSKQDIGDTQSHFAEIQSIYFQAWIAKRLGWTFLSLEKEDRHGRIKLLYTKDEKRIQIDIGPYYNQFLDDGTISSIEINSSNGIHYLVHYEHDDRHIVVHSSSSDRCDMPFTLFSRSFQRSALFINALLQKSLDTSQYRSIVAEIQSLSYMK
ncbi:MAG: glucose-6-phosphate dehydrogenase assembly protein OpcA [Chlamydia sp.]